MSYTPLSSDNAAMLLVDHQTGLSNGVTDQSTPEYFAAVEGLVKTSKAFSIPTVVTTSAADGPKWTDSPTHSRNPP